MVKYPEDWKVVPLKEVYDIGSSKRVFQSQWRHSGIPFYRARDIVGFINGEEAVGDLFIDVSLYEEYKRAYGVPGIDDLLVTAVGTLGKVYRVTDHHPFYFKDGNIIWFKSTGKIDSCFVEQLFVSGHLDDQIYDTAGGSTVGTYTITSANKTQIPFPPLPEQKRIAAVLGNVDKLIDNLSRQIEKKRLVKQGVMQDLLTGRKRLPGFKGEWEEKKLGEIESEGLIRLYRGKVISKLDMLSNPGEYPIYSSSVIHEGLMGRYGDYMFNEELISWSIDGGGNFFYRPKHRFSVTNVCGYMKVDVTRTCCRYLAYELQYLHSFKMFDYQTKAHPSVIRKEYDVRIPPSLAEQKAIAKVLGDMDAEIAKLEAKCEKYRHLKQGLMNDLLTGKVRI